MNQLMPSTFQSTVQIQSRQYFDQKSFDFSNKYSHHPSFKERYLIWNQTIQRYARSYAEQALCLDIGCGPGIMTGLIAYHGMRAVGIDQSTSMLAIAVSSAKQQGVESLTEFICASIPLPLKLEAQFLNSVDMIVCSSVLEYIPDWQAALRQFHTLLKPNGILLISLPNRQSLYRAMERGLKHTPIANRLYIKHQHHQFDPQATNRQFAALGYEVLEKSYFALPFQGQLSWLVGKRRPDWLATMFLVAARKVTSV